MALPLWAATARSCGVSRSRKATGKQDLSPFGQHMGMAVGGTAFDEHHRQHSQHITGKRFVACAENQGAP